MTQTDESEGLEVAREIMPVGFGGAEDAARRPETPAPPSPHWTGALPSSSCGVMAVVGDDGYLIPLWTAGDLLRACRIYWHSAND